MKKCNFCGKELTVPAVYKTRHNGEYLKEEDWGRYHERCWDEIQPPDDDVESKTT